MSTGTAVATLEPKRSLIADMASRFNMEAKAFADTLRGTVVPKNATNEEFAAFLMVAKEYDLNPITKEIFAFPKQGGGIQPIVSVDGWCNLVNSHPQCDGFEFEDHLTDKGDLVSVTCKIYRKDRSRPTTATEYMSECRRDTSTWKQWPRRMLRHKALIQAARYAFGFAGIVDQDEAERIVPETPKLVPPPAPGPTAAAKAHIIEAMEAESALEAPSETTPAEEAALDRAAMAGEPEDKMVVWINEKIDEAQAADTMAILNEIDDAVCAALDTANRDDQRVRWNTAYAARKVALQKRR